jgi:DNA adenine methylase
MVTRPVLRYHGGKWKLAKWVIAHFPQHDIYVEPFGGAASVLLQKERSRSEVYNDKYDNVVNVFRVLRDPDAAKELQRLCLLTPFSKSELELAGEPSGDPVEQARRTIVLSFMGRQPEGVTGSRTRTLRFYRDGNSVSREWAVWPEEIAAFVDRLRGVTIEQQDALSVIAKYDTPSTLLFVDPPYVHSTRSDIQASRGSYHHEMSDADHEGLSRVLHSCKGMVVLSGYSCELYRDLYSDWNIVTRKHYAEQASPRTECLWLSPNVTPAQGKLLEVA